MAARAGKLLKDLTQEFDLVLANNDDTTCRNTTQIDLTFASPANHILHTDTLVTSFNKKHKGVITDIRYSKPPLRPLPNIIKKKQSGQKRK